jgi:hypothetical protein
VDQDNKPFVGSEVPTVREKVVTLSGDPILGEGEWKRSNNSISPSGVFVDYLSYSEQNASLAVQTFSVDGGPALGVSIGGAGGNGSLLINSYNESGVTINGTSSPRRCEDKDVR